MTNRNPNRQRCPTCDQPIRTAKQKAAAVRRQMAYLRRRSERKKVT